MAVNPGIFLVQGDKTLLEMSEQQYDSEDLLQALLANYPSLLAGNQIDTESPRRWILVTREAGVPDKEDGGDRWSVDNLFIDQDGIPTIVEVKRGTDTRIRREVVGQMLDYAANAVAYWPAERLRSLFEARHAQQQDGAESELVNTFGVETDPDAFWGQVETNLRAGKVRMIFVADVVPAELRRIVEFLNEQMTPAEVLAVEIKQYVGQQLKVLVPRVIGQTEKANQDKPRSHEQGEHWTQSTFLDDLSERRGEKGATAARAVFQWATERGIRLWWGRGKRDGSGYLLPGAQGSSHFLVALWSSGGVEVQFQWMLKRPPFDQESKRREFLELLNRIPGVAIPQDAIARRPTFPLSVLTEPSALKEFLSALEWFVKQIDSQ